MKNNKNKLMDLSDIHGVLPPMNSDNIIILLCIKEETDENTIFSHLDYFFKNFMKIHVHIHIIGNKKNLKEKLIIFSNLKYNITVTEESFEFKNFSFTEDVLSKVSIIRLYHFINLLKVPVAFTTSLNLLLDLNLYRTEIINSPILIDKQYSQRILVNGQKKSLSLLGSITKIFLKDLASNTNIKKQPPINIISLVIEKALEKKPDLVKFIEVSKYKNIETDNRVNKEKYLTKFWPTTNKFKILLLKPELTLPFKSPPLVSHVTDHKDNSPFSHGKQASLRDAWEKCYELIQSTLLSLGHTPITIVRPGSEITPKLANLTKADLVIVPHKQKFQFENAIVPCLYLMQVAHRWVFTIDQDGWGAGANNYPYNQFKTCEPDGSVFEKYKELTLQNNESKFNQKERKPKSLLIQEGIIPDKPFIFFPCQIPDDEVIKYFSKVREEEVIIKLSEWANKNKIYIVFKEHPADPDSCKHFKRLTKGSYVKWSDASVHDLLDNCFALYTINSGVGHEAILHSKPIVMFGASEYDELAIKSDINLLDEAYMKLRSWNKDEMENLYKKYYHWFIKEIAIDILDHESAHTSILKTLRKIEKSKNGQNQF